MTTAHPNYRQNSPVVFFSAKDCLSSGRDFPSARKNAVCSEQKVLKRVKGVTSADPWTPWTSRRICLKSCAARGWTGDEGTEDGTIGRLPTEGELWQDELNFSLATVWWNLAGSLKSKNWIQHKGIPINGQAKFSFRFLNDIVGLCYSFSRHIVNSQYMVSDSHSGHTSSSTRKNLDSFLKEKRRRIPWPQQAVTLRHCSASPPKVVRQ